MIDAEFQKDILGQIFGFGGHMTQYHKLVLCYNNTILEQFGQASLDEDYFNFSYTPDGTELVKRCTVTNNVQFVFNAATSACTITQFGIVNSSGTLLATGNINSSTAKTVTVNQIPIFKSGDFSLSFSVGTAIDETYIWKRVAAGALGHLLGFDKLLPCGHRLHLLDSSKQILTTLGSVPLYSNKFDINALAASATLTNIEQLTFDLYTGASTLSPRYYAMIQENTNQMILQGALESQSTIVATNNIPIFPSNSFIVTMSSFT